jgi:HSP20 family molecular chaperone IbpA
MVEVYESNTESRKIIDLAIPGFAKEDVKVSTAVQNGGEDFVIKVKGTYSRPLGATGKKVPLFAFDKVVDQNFSWKVTYDTGLDYDFYNLTWDLKNGVLRISVPKTPEAIGNEVLPVAEGQNVNIVASPENEDDDENS